jgi:hypothetical protein
MVPFFEELSPPEPFFAAMMNLLAFGNLKPIDCLFPFAPGITDLSELIKLCVKSEPFPQDSPPPATIPVVQYRDDIAISVRKEVLTHLPPKWFMPPPQLSRSTTAHFDIFTPKLCEDFVKANSVQNWSSWDEFSPRVITDIFQTSVASDVFKFTAKVVIHFWQKGLKAEKLLKILFYGNTMTDPSYSLSICGHLTAAIFRRVNKIETFCRFLVEFISHRFCEGWLRGNDTEILNLLLINCKFSRDRILPCVFDGIIQFMIVHSVIADTVALILAHRTVIFKDIDVRFILLLYDRIGSLPAESVQPLLDVIFEISEGNFELRGMREQIANCTFAKQTDVGAFSSILNLEIHRSLEHIAGLRRTATTIFITSTTAWLTDIVTDSVSSRSVCACLRHFQRSMLLFEIAHFCRVRESKLTGDRSFFTKYKTTRKTISLLTDPVYPTRRPRLSRRPGGPRTAIIGPGTKPEARSEPMRAAER